jgi:ABC-type phosphate transport system substrate-binding protein
MSRRISVALAGALAVGSLSMVAVAGSASAEPTATPALTDIVGAGSDTTQVAMDNLAYGTTVDGTAVSGYNSGKATGLLQTFDAAALAGQPALSAQVTLKSGDTPITRPNGSGVGKGLLYNPSNPSLDFARSSSSLSPAEVSAGLWQVPFAVDGLKMAVSGNVASHAPAFVTPAALVKIYNGTYKNWNQIPGNSAHAGVIKPLIPQSGSGTRSFFTAQLQAANNGNPVALASTVTEVQEHDPTPIENDANAIAPFSTGRAKGLSEINLLRGASVGGFEAKRALYNVVRNGSTGTTASWYAGIFGENGFICSAAAKPLIEAAGFSQLASTANGGVCGQATQATTTNFTSTGAPAQDTTTTLTGSNSSQTVRLTATVKGADNSAATGSVLFYDGATLKGEQSLSGGVALLSLPSSTVGTHKYTAFYTSDDESAFNDSSSPETSVVVAKTSSKTAVTMASRFKKGTRQKATVKVTTTGHTPTGKVLVKRGTRQIASGSLSAGKSTITLPAFTPGSVKLTFSYSGDSRTNVSSVSKTVTVTR